MSRFVLARSFFTEQQKKDIDAAVATAEKTTSGEIVPVLATRAAPYGEFRYHAAIGFAMLATLAVFGAHLLLHEWLERDVWEIPFYVILPVQLVALVAGYRLAAASPKVHRAFIPRALLQARVEHAARRAFRDLGIAKTKDATGIMLYVSLFERTAIVLGDKAITAKCPQSTWDQVRDLLVGGFAKGDGAAGFTQAIAECGKILSKDFPIKADDTNELPNTLRVI